MKISMYSIVIFCFALCFSGKGMENSYSGPVNSLNAKPLKITITNDDLDQNGSYYFPSGSRPGSEEITIPFSNSIEGVLRIDRMKSRPFGISFYGRYDEDAREQTRISAIFPEIGKSVEMEYVGKKSRDFDIRLFYLPNSWEIFKPAVQKHCALVGRVLPGLDASKVSVPGPTVHLFQKVKIQFEPDSCAGLIFSGLTCPSASKEICFLDNELRYKVKDCKNVSSIHISLDKSAWTETNFQPKITINRTSEAG
jgi:hypothetical protein